MIFPLDFIIYPNPVGLNSFYLNFLLSNYELSKIVDKFSTIVIYCSYVDARQNS